MTPNDSEMDVLLRRFAKVGSGVKSTEHLDADELNAFAEGALPPAARSRYVSHLADCDDCRRVVSELAAASGRVQEISVPASQPVAVETWWQRIGGLFAPSRLRYAAFAAVLIAVAGIGYTVWRQSHGTPAGVASPFEQVSTSESARAPQPQEPTSSGVASTQSPAIAKNVTQSTPAPFLDQKQPQSNDAGPPPPPKPADVLARNETAPSTGTTTRAAEPSANAAAPSYAPPPAVETERADNRSREQQNLGYLHGPQRGVDSVAKNKTMDDRSRAGDFAKSRDEDRARTGNDQPVTKEESKDVAARKRSESRPATLASRPAAGERQEAPKSDKAGPPEEADTRTVGGRKFKRQGNAWIDLKLKSSMSIQTILRGSDDFDKLDSGLRSIAQQFGGPVVVVWKGKAYRIQ